MSTPATRFSLFNIRTTSYKTVGDHEIAVNLLVPKKLQSGKAPVFVKWHGGGLVIGEALYPDWFAAWIVPFCLRNNAITVLPNYRLLPESSGKDIMEDIDDFWKWFDKDLKSFAKEHLPNVELDFDHLLVGGESAGGLMALQSAIRTPQANIKALLCQYPMTSYLTRENLPELFMGMPRPGPEYAVQHIAAMKPGVVVSSSLPTEKRTMLSGSLTQIPRNRWKEFFGEDKELLPMTAVDAADSLPPTLIIHGEDDCAVNVNDSREFVKKAEGKGEINLVTKPGDHGFEVEMSEDDNPWLKEAAAWVEKRWLS